MGNLKISKSTYHNSVLPHIFNSHLLKNLMKLQSEPKVLRFQESWRFFVRFENSANEISNDAAARIKVWNTSSLSRKYIISSIHLLLNKLDTTCGTQNNKHKTLVLVHQTRHKNNMRTTKHKLGYRLVLCLVVLMLFFSDSSDEQALGFSACYNRRVPLPPV